MAQRALRTRTTSDIGITEEQFLEIQRCATDCVYFLQTYGNILDPVRGPLPFKLYKYQKEAIRAYMNHQYNITLKSRQMGFSWLTGGFVLWVAMFYTNRNVQMISIKENTAKRLLDKVKYIYDHLPDWMKVKIVDDNKTLLTFSHGSRIESIPTSEDAGRSEGVTLLVIDEAAFVRWIDKVWQAAEPTLSTGGMCILLSTPNGIGNFFHKSWIEAKSGTNGFNTIYAPWYLNPVFGAGKVKRTIRLANGKKVRRWVSPWYMDRMRKLGPRRVQQEIDCEFLSTGHNFFDTVVLNERFQEVIDPNRVKFRTRWNLELRVFKKPRPGGIYVMGIDTATGHGEDYSTFSIRDFTTWEQVATYRTQLPVPMFALRCDQIARFYNNAFVVGEENGVSIATLLQMRDVYHYPEDQFFMDVNVEDRETRGTLGWVNTNKSRRVYLNAYEQVVRESINTFKDARLVAELMSFVVKPNGRYEAQDDYTDDMVFADLCCFIGLTNYQPCGALPFKVA